MCWLISQSTVMMIIGCTGAYYHWTPNPVALGIVMVGSAWLFTKIVLALIWTVKSLRKLCQRALRRQPRTICGPIRQKGG